MMISRRTLLTAAAAASFAGPAFAEFPDKAIRIIVPWTPGGVTDVLARSVANAMTQTGGQPVIVENRPGANGAIGAMAASRSAPDGYTLFVSNADTHATNPFIYPKLQYDALKSFKPVSLFARIPFALIAGSAKPITDFKSFVSVAKAAPNELTYASWGVGSASHLGMELIARSAGIEVRHVPFLGQAPAVLAVQGQHIDAMLLPAGGANSAASNGSAKLLAVTSEKRLELMPKVPTLREVGIDQEMGNWFGFHVPAGTPDAIIQKLSKFTSDALQDPAVIDTFRAQAAIPESGGPQQLADHVLSEQKRWGSIIRAANIKVE